MAKRIIGLILIVIVIISATGCWGITELNEIGLVTATGVDLEPDGSIRITVMSAQPEGQPSMPLVRSSTWIGTATGKNLIDASKNLRRTAMKRLTWVHNTIIIIGEDVAKYKMEEIIDYFSRNSEVRFNSYVLVAAGRACELMQTPADIQSDLSREILGIIRNVDEWSRSYVSNAKDLLVSHAGHCGDYVTGRLEFKGEKNNTFSAPREDYEKLTLRGEEIPSVFLEGCAVFKNAKMVGTLDTVETRGYLWITNNVMAGTIVTDQDGGTLSMESNFSRTSVKMKADGKDITAVIHVDTRGTLVEQTTGHDLSRESVMETVEDGIAKEIKSEMEAAVKKARTELQVDIFGFGTQLHKTNPKVWEKVQKEWNDVIFPRVRIEYEVNVTIERTGKLLKGLYR